MRQHGQTLIELVVSIGIVLIIITGVTILTIRGLQNSQFARNQVQATKLAQEGIEKMRTIRDNRFTVCGSSTTPNVIITNGLWGVSCSAGCRYILNSTPSVCPSPNVTSTLWINFTASPSLTEDITIGNIIFKRVVIVTDGSILGGTPSPNSGVKDINVTVTWTDSSGTHNSNVSTVLTNI